MNLSPVERTMLPSLLEFYRVPEHFRILQRFRDGSTVVTQSGARIKYSASLLDWFTVNYCKMYGVQYTITRHGRKRSVHVEQCYHAALSAFKKEYFDPFARGSKRNESFCIANAEGEQVETTVRQLNYFRWAIDKGVIAYVDAHIERIYNDMCERSNRGRRKKSDEPKRQLTVSSSHAVHIQELKPSEQTEEKDEEQTRRKQAPKVKVTRRKHVQRSAEAGGLSTES